MLKNIVVMDTRSPTRASTVAGVDPPPRAFTWTETRCEDADGLHDVDVPEHPATHKETTAANDETRRRRTGRTAKG